MRTASLILFLFCANCLGQLPPEMFLMSRQATSGPSSLYTSLVAYWTLDETSGTRDDSIAANDLADGNTVSYSAGINGNAANFVAANSELLSHATSSALEMGDIDFTMSFWINTDLSNTEQTILSKYDPATNDREYAVRIRVDNYVELLISPSGTSATAVAATAFGTISTGTWYHIIAWHDSVNNSAGVSVNGTANTAAYSGGVFASSTDFKLSSRSGGTFFDGAIDEVAIWKRMLTAGEKTSLYNSGSGLFYPF